MPIQLDHWSQGIFDIPGQVFARSRLASLGGLGLEPGTGVGRPPEAAYSCPHTSRRMCPGMDAIPGPCGHAARGFPRCATESCPAVVFEPCWHIRTESVRRVPTSQNTRGSCIWRGFMFRMPEAHVFGVGLHMSLSSLGLYICWHLCSGWDRSPVVYPASLHAPQTVTRLTSTTRGAAEVC